MTRIALYPGTFDPLTKGHENIITRAGALCDVLYVAIAIGHHKKTLFTLEERLAMAKAVCADVRSAAEIRVIGFAGLLMDVCRERGASFIIRGIRTTTDFDYEAQLSAANHHLAPEIETVFLFTDHHYSFLSSSIIRETAQLGGDVSAWVHPIIKENLTDKVLRKN